MAIKDLDVAYNHLPNLFDRRRVPDAFDDNFLTIPIDDPDGVIPPPTQVEDPSTPRDVEEFMADDLDRGIPPEPIDLPDLEGGHAGAPVHRDPSQQAHPDALAFYLPFHYYYPDYWGVYLTVAGVNHLAREIRRLSTPRVSSRDAIRTARRFLYYHEAFHHHTECFAFRLETTHRRPLYRTGFAQLFQRTYFTNDCLEEGLANAHALKSTEKAPKPPPAAVRALETIVSNSPPGYNRGVEFRRRFRDHRSTFAELNHTVALPGIPDVPAAIWNAAPHLFNGIANVKSRVNYLLPRRARLAQRLPLGRPYRLREFTKQLKKVLGARQIPRLGTKHDVWESADGTKRTRVARHPGGIPTGTQLKILRDLGYLKGLNEFYHR